MKHRIITHGGCTSMDGFASAFIFKKYFCPLFGIKDVEIIGLNPIDIQQEDFPLEEGDIVLDLPKPSAKIFFWADHHRTAKPDGKLPENHYWREVPSNTGLLIDILKEKGVKVSKKLLDFKKALDMMDGAQYTKEDISLVYYPQKSYAKLSMLQKVHIVSSLFHTKDFHVNVEIMHYLLSEDLGETPVDGKVWDFQPLLFHRAQLAGYAEWRAWFDEFAQLQGNAIVVDYRDKPWPRGNTDRFYAYMKFDDAVYSVNLKIVDEKYARVGIGSNIFHKDLCKVNIGEICREVGKTFGEGAGGGHYYVGGATILAKNCDKALKFVLGELK